jgi:polysaccharide export outer membrane protein
MQSPQVFVTVKEYNSQRVTVDGAVKEPGVFPLKGKTTLVEAVAQAGGLNEMGSPSSVYVLRQVDGKKMAARFDLNEIRKGQKQDPVMRAGDIVMVDESGSKVMFKNLQSMTGFTGIFSLLML